jgi:hypothetical protein
MRWGRLGWKGRRWRGQTGVAELEAMTRNGEKLRRESVSSV